MNAESTTPIDGALLITLSRLLVGTTHKRPAIGIAGVPDSTVDFCCGTHAQVASLTLAKMGIKTRVARGRAVVYTAGAMMSLLNHFFVVRDDDGAVFDSSIHFPIPGGEKFALAFTGITFNECPSCPALRIEHKMRNPVGGENEELIARGQANPMVLYVEDVAQPPEYLLDYKVADGEFARWARQTFGTQLGLTARFAQVITEEMRKGAASACLDREVLIQRVREAMPGPTITKFRAICEALSSGTR